jgi:hypothetical protein
MLLLLLFVIYASGGTVFFYNVEHPVIDWLDDNQWAVPFWPIVLVIIAANIVYQYFAKKYNALTEQNQLIFKVGIFAGIVGAAMSSFVRYIGG